MADLAECNTTEMNDKPGWRTTEFYVTALTALMPVLTAVFHKEFSSAQVQNWAAMAAAIATVGYSFSRSRSKQASITAKATVQAACATGSTPTSAVGLAGAGTAPMPVTASGAGSTVSPQGVSVNAIVPVETLSVILARLDQIAAAQGHQVPVPSSHKAAS